MKVAICFYGQPRHLDNPYTLLSHKYWIIDRYKADVFCHAWISGKEIDFDYADQVKQHLKSKEDINSKDIILTKYKPKNYLFEKPRKFEMLELRPLLKEKEIDYTSKINGTFNWSENNENNHFSQLYSLSKSISLLNNEYDWVILSRYDNYILDFPNLYLLERDKLYLDNTWPSTFSDVILIGGQRQIETLNFYDRIPELTKDIYYFCPEEYKRIAFQEKYGLTGPESIGEWGYIKGQEKRIKIKVGVVRGPTLENIQY